MNGDVGGRRINKRDETESTRISSNSILHYDNFHDLPVFPEIIAEMFFHRVPRNPADEELPLLARKIRNGEMGLRPKFLHFMEDGIRIIPSSGTGISRYRHPVPSSGTRSVLEASGTGSVLEASSTAPGPPFNPIPVIQNWMRVSGTGYRS